jgi:plastocyanin
MMLRACAVRFVAACSLVVATLAAHAAGMTIQVLDQAGQPVADAVVYAEPASGQAVPTPLTPGEVEQRKRAFQPLVTVVQTGTSISFPNNDTVRHHVYSFSPAKVFELKLFSGEGRPVVFDKAGTVVVGCNIHDKMVAYIQVVDTPYFAKTDADGNASLNGMLPGKYRVKAWHFRLATDSTVPEQTIAAGSGAAVAFKLNLKAGNTIIKN